jgi:acyl-CoA synthetase (AMP-forming)/AMP-acid ligase II
MSGATIFQLFAEVAKRDGDGEALLLSRRRVSFAQLKQQIDRAADRLSGEAGQGKPVVISTDDAEALLVDFFAAAALGRPALPLDPALPASVLALIEQPAAAALAESGGAGADSEFYWGLTSGTTGDPKLFARSHASWTASFAAAESVFAFEAGSQILVPGPLHHSLFLYGAVHGLCRGHSVILPGPFRPNRIADAAQATHLYAVPFMLGELLKARVPMPALGAIFCGGAKLSAELRRDCETAWPQADLVEFYGASETSFVSFHSTRRRASAGSVGRPFPGVAIESRGEGGKVLPPGETGQIFVASPMLFSRYVGELPAERWFSARDMGFIDTGGCLHLTGRSNRMIKSKGLKIHPESIEAALLALPQVSRVAVVDLPDRLRGAVAVAAIEFAAGAPVPRKTLTAHCRATLGSRYCPRSYFAAEALPVTRSGKVAVAEIRQALLDGHAAYREIR